MPWQPVRARLWKRVMNQEMPRRLFLMLGWWGGCLFISAAVSVRHHPLPISDKLVENSTLSFHFGKKQNNS